jgi:hypothetical protein
MTDETELPRGRLDAVGYSRLPADVAEQIGLQHKEYGLMHCEDDAGEHWTVLTDDMEYVRLMGEAGMLGVPPETVPLEKFPMARRGWPEEWPELSTGRKGD